MTGPSTDAGPSPGDLRPPLAGRAVRLLGAGVLVYVLVLSLTVAMQMTDHNENMYLAAAVLVEQGKELYSDFAFVQMPDLPLIHAALFRITGTTHYQLAARLFTWLAWLLTVALLGRLLYRASGDGAMAFLLAMLFAASSPVLRIVMECSNYVLPMLFSLIALACLLRTARAEARSPLLLFGSGVFVALAVGTKLYYLAAAVPVLAGALFVHRQRNWGRRIAWQFGPATAGFIAGLAPVWYYWFRAPRAFWFNNLQFHSITTQNYELIGYLERTDLAAKLRWLVSDLLAEVTLTVVVLGALTGYFLWKARRAGKNEQQPSESGSWVLAAIAGSSLICTVAAALYMTPLWPQYFAMPVPYAFLLLGCGYRCLNNSDQRIVRAGALVVMALALALHLPLLMEASVIRPETWAPVREHAQAHQVREILAEHGIEGKLATLQPVYAIEAGLPIYDELAAGPFLFNIADRLTAEERREFVATAPRSVGGLFDRDPPAAILAGFYQPPPNSDWISIWDESALIEYAKQHGYKKIDLPAMNAALYLRPARRSINRRARTR